MSTKDKTSTNAKFLIQDLIFVVVFFLISYFFLRPSVPVESPFWVSFWAGLVGLAMAGTAWIALWMFRIVLIDQLAARKENKSKK